MSIIQTIRDKAAVIVVGAIALSLIAFMVQDALGSKDRLFGSSSSIGSVNGTKISREEFQKKIDFYTKQNNGQMQQSQLVTGVWDLMVQKAVMDEQYEKLGIDVTSNELSDMLFGDNPPDWMKQAFTSKTTGLFDVNAAKKQFNDLKKRSDDPQVQDLNTAYIEPTVEQGKMQKYQSLISGAVYVPKWMGEKLNADANAIANASYVYVPYTSISDSTIKVSDDEIAAYISKHSKQFERKEETRSISYVTFSASATASDSNAVKNDLGLLKNEFASAPDLKSFLSVKGSQMEYYDSYIGRKDIKQPSNITDSLFATPAGSFYGPYSDNGNMVLARVISSRTVPDSASVRHILVATHQLDQQSGGLYRVAPDSVAMKRLDSAIAEIKAGKSWDSVCVKYSDDPGSKTKGGMYENFPTGQMDAAFNDFAFTGSAGESKIVHTMYGYHYVQITAQKGSQAGYKIAYLAKPVVPSSETDNTASNAAAAFASKNHSAKEFNDNAAKQKLTVLPSMELKKMDYQVQGLGESRSLIKWAFENNAGTVSEPMNIGDKYVVAVITAVNNKGTASVESARMSVEPLVKNEKKAQLIINNKMKGNSLEDIARSAGVAVQNADSTSFVAYTFGKDGGGAEPKVIGACFNKQAQGKVSAPIAGNSGVYVIKASGISAASNLGSNAESQRTQLEQIIKQQVGYQIVNILKESADVDDNRSEFY